MEFQGSSDEYILTKQTGEGGEGKTAKDRVWVVRGMNVYAQYVFLEYAVGVEKRR